MPIKCFSLLALLAFAPVLSHATTTLHARSSAYQRIRHSHSSAGRHMAVPHRRRSCLGLSHPRRLRLGVHPDRQVPGGPNSTSTTPGTPGIGGTSPSTPQPIPISISPSSFVTSTTSTNSTGTAPRSVPSAKCRLSPIGFTPLPHSSTASAKRNPVSSPSTSGKRSPPPSIPVSSADLSLHP